MTALRPTDKNSETILQGVRVRRAITLFCVGMVLVGCARAEAPFVFSNPLVLVGKEKDSIHRTGLVVVCFNEADLGKAKALAQDSCKEYGLEAMEKYTERYQCKITAPHKITFRCYDPKMRFANGAWVNPVDKIQVKQWRLEQAMITGKSVSEIYAGPTRAIPDMDEPVQRPDVDEPLKIGN